MKYNGFGLTDVGTTRTHNEDSFSVDNEAMLYIVADGVGGRSAGEVASRMAVDVVRDHIAKCDDNDCGFLGTYNDTLSKLTNRLASAVRLANKVVHESARGNPAMSGMGSTIVAAAIEGKRLSLAHAGDSRAYIIRDRAMNQLTADHSLVMEQFRRGLITKEQAEKSEIKNIITRALGPEPEVDVEIAEHALVSGDRLLLCSDGLSGMVPDEEMLDIVLGSDRIDRACLKLIEAANKGGGQDNITVVIVEAQGGGIFSFLNRLSL